MKWMLLALLAVAHCAIAQISSSQIAAMQPVLSADEVDDDDRRDQFRLYTQCGKIDFHSSVSPLAEDLGLTTDAINSLGVERLEEAGVYSDASSRAFVSVSVFGNESGAYYTRLRFWKLVDDGTFTKTLGWANTWLAGIPSTAPSGDAILGQMTALLNIFLAEYVRINDEACNPSTIVPSLSAECYSSSVTSPSPVMGQTDEVITLLDGSKWEVGIGHYHYLYAYYPNVVVCLTEGIMLIRETVGDEATELRVTKL